MANELLLSAQKLRWEDRRSLPAASMTGSYVGVGPSFQHPVRTLWLDNLSDADLDISFDGVVDKTIIAAQSGKVFDIGSNMATQAGNLEQPLGERVYVKINPDSAAPTNGKGFYVSVNYAGTV